jgi:hypothetical protein
MARVALARQAASVPAMGSAEGPQASFAYLVIVSRPHVEGGRRSNEDAVAASLVNMLHLMLGARQRAVRGLDLRNPEHRALVTRMLAERRLPAEAANTTPLLFSARENVFTKPGRISLQLVLDIASQMVPRGPTPEVLATLLAYPARHDLEFLPAWAAALEAAEAPERRLVASAQVQAKPRTFSPGERGQVTLADISAHGVAGVPTAAGKSAVSSHLADGMDTHADHAVAETMWGSQRFPINAIPDGHGGVIAGTAEAGGGGGGGGGSAAPSARFSIENRMLDSMPEIRNVTEQSAISERSLIAMKHGTDEAATKEEIQRVRIERARARLRD